MRVRYALFALAVLALILAAAAFLVALQANSHNASVAAADAKAAAADAKAAAAVASTAVAQVAVVHSDLCSFLDVMRHAKVDEQAEAAHLYVLYRCAP
jgi:hypothetical protein